MKKYLFLVIIFFNISVTIGFSFEVESTIPDNNTKGVPAAITITITFNNTVEDPTSWVSISDYILLKKIKDKDGNSLDTPVSIPVTAARSDTDNKILQITPNTLDKGPTFRLTLTSQIKDTLGVGLFTLPAITFTTLWDSSKSNAVTGTDGLIKINMPYYILPADGFCEIIENPMSDTIISTPANIESANAAIIDSADPLKYPITSTMKEFVLYEGDVYNKTALTDTLFEKNSANELPEITLSYNDVDNDGIIDGTDPQIYESNIAIYRLNIQSNTWEKLGGNVDKTNNTITAETNRVTIFVVVGGIYQDLSQAKAYPVPFTPNSNPLHTHITFAGLQPNSIIKIYTISGRLVRTLSADYLGSNIQWNATNDSNETLPSGVYIYYISSPTTHKSSKLIIIR